MKALFLSMALLAAATSAFAGDRHDTDRPITVAVFGDWPYNQNLLDNAPLLINSVNSEGTYGHRR